MLFLPECIFCDKLDKRIDTKTERLVKFQSWKHKEPACKQIESRVKALDRKTQYAEF